MAHYTLDDLRAALAALPFGRGDVVFSHSNIGYFGRPAGITSGDALCRMMAEAVLERLGPEGTLVVPTFTYSFPKGEVFDPSAPSAGMGMFAEWVRCHPDARRSVDPCYSVAAIGGAADTLTADAPENSFGPGSFFERLWAADGKIVNLNFDAGSTFVHYVERELGVPYRFDKTFTGRIRENGEERPARSTIFVRHLSDDSLVTAFEPFDTVARQAGRLHTASLGRGEIALISTRDTYDLIARTLPDRPWFLTRAEDLGITAPRIVPESEGGEGGAPPAGAGT